ncbi:MAG: DUF3810 family protein [Planctomycetota bacterium]
MVAEPKANPRKQSGPLSLRLLLWVTVVLAGLWTAFPPPRGIVESVYSRGIFRMIGAVLVALQDAAPFPIGPVFLALGLIGVPLAAFALWRRRRRSGCGRLRSARPVVELLFGTAVLVYAGFLVLWGGNYRRDRVETLLELEDAEVSAGDVTALCEYFVEVIRRDVPGDDQVLNAEDWDPALRDAMAQFLEDTGFPTMPLPARVKRTPEGLFLTFGTSGMLLPVFIEALTDGALPVVQHVGTAAHELAHVVGFAGEADADLVGTLAALRSSEAFLRYCGAVHGLRRAWSSLEKEDRSRLLDRLPKRCLKDLKEMRDVADRHRNETLDDLQSSFHDKFLKSQGVSDGMRDYSRAVQLLVRARRAKYFGS